MLSYFLVSVSLYRVGVSVDLSAVDKAVFLELFRLDGDLSLHNNMHAAGRGLPGVHVCGHPQAPAAGYTLPPTTTGPHHVSEGS